MADTESTRSRVDELLRRQPHGDGGGIAEELDRLCRAACEDLTLLGAAATLMPSPAAHVVSAVSPEATRELEEAQFGAGEGPTHDAFTARRPVLVADLEPIGLSRWPGWAPLALSAGACAVYAFPLHIGATIFGALTLYAGPTPNLDGRRLETAFVFSEIATEILLDASRSGEGQQLESHVDAALDTHAHVYQAQGMLMVDLGVSLAEALARMRAHAWATEQSLTTLAGEIVAGLTRLPRDDQ